MKLAARLLEKPWGREILPPPFDSIARTSGREGARIGEIWFEPADGADLPIFVKYIFTSEKLSVQVHPDDEQARAFGCRSGKNECWYITDAQPGAMLGLGLKRAMTGTQLQSAALDGSIEQLLDWRPIHPGEFYIIPAGTIHAMSGGIGLIEFQQNAGVTFRLYDYGRPRELHLERAVAVAKAEPFPAGNVVRVNRGAVNEQVLVRFPQFDVIYSGDVVASRARTMGQALWIVPLSGVVRSEAGGATCGEVLHVAPGEDLVEVEQNTSALIGIAA